MTNKLTSHLRGNAIAYVALFIALGGTSVAATVAANSVNTRALQNRAVTAEKIGALPAVSASTTDFDQQLTDGQFSAVRLEQEAFDIGGMHSPGEQDSRLVAPRTGTYVVEGTVVFENKGACGGSPRVAIIQRHKANGQTINVDHVNSDTVCGEPQRVHAGAVVRLRRGEYLELIAFERSTPTLGVGGSMSAAFVGG